MKALVMLDHVMLWVARGFIIMAFIATLTLSFVSKNSVVGTCFAIGTSVLWLICILQFNHAACRYILGFSSFFFLLYFPLSHPFFPISMHYCIPMMGLIAIFWTALLGSTAQKKEPCNPVNLVNPV